MEQQTRVNWPFLRRESPEIQRAEGVYLYTSGGKAILDAAGGAIVSNIGHGRARVAQRVAEATADCTYVVPPWTTPSRQALVEALEANWLPEGLRRIHITSGGSEAVEAAVKMAIQYHAARGEPGRRQIISRSVSYHGTTMATTSLSGHPARKRGLEHALCAEFIVPTPYPLRCPLGSHHPDAGRFYIENLRNAILSEGPENIAALLAEPITGSSGGALVPPDDYWVAVRDICDEFGLLLILDEVMTGFGRTGKPFAYQHWDIEPDILVSGKGLAGGYAPIGGVYASETVGSTIQKAGMNVMFHTFGAHPAACAAAAEVLNIMAEEQLVEQAARKGQRLKRLMHEAFDQHPHVAEVRGRGLLLAIEVVKNRETLETYPEQHAVSDRIVGKALGKGVFFYGGGTGDVRDIVCIGPAFIIEEPHLQTMTEILLEAVNEVTA